MHSSNTIILRIYIILYFWGTQCFEERSKLCTFNIHTLKKKVVHSTYNVTQRVYIILYIQSTPFIKEGWKYCTSYKHKFSKKFTHSTNTKLYSQIYYLIFFFFKRSKDFFWGGQALFCKPILPNYIYIYTYIFVGAVAPIQMVLHDQRPEFAFLKRKFIL